MRSTILKSALILLGLAAVLRLYLYIMGGLYIPVTTDEALTVLQALDIRAGEWPLLLSAQPYMFPVEAYWMAPFVNLLPRTAFGLRVLVMIEGGVFLALTLLILRRMGPWRKIWPGAVLALFPSVYLVMNQTAYSQPHNNSAFILALAAVWFVTRLNEEDGPRDFWFALGGGFFAVFAFSNAILSLSLVAPLAVLALLHCIRRGWLARVAGYLAGAALGLLPYLAALWRFPGAHGSVTATFGWGHALKRVWSPAITWTMPVTFGFKPCFFPDSGERLDWGTWGYSLFPYLFVLILLVVVFVAVRRLWYVVRAREPLTLGPMEWALGVTVLTLILFGLSRRADSSAYRYLAPLTVVFPFLIAGLYQESARWSRWIIGILTVGLASYNVATSVRLPFAWTDPAFGPDIVSAPDLRPALKLLKEKGIHHAVASHWVAYRIGFESAGDVTCSQPYNERFPGWPIPYKTEVDASTNVAYVLTDKVRFLKPHIFERHLRAMDVEWEHTRAGDFDVYYGFRQSHAEEERRLSPDSITVTASENGDEAIRMNDGNPESFWRSAELQHEGLWVEFEFDAPQRIARLILDHARFGHDRGRALRVSVRTGGGWQPWDDAIRPDSDPFAWRNGHPVYGTSRQTLALQTGPVTALRIELAETDSRWCWTLAEVEFYVSNDETESGAPEQEIHK